MSKTQCPKLYTQGLVIANDKYNVPYLVFNNIRGLSNLQC